MSALPAALYDDPEQVVSAAETGDQVPRSRVKPTTCFECVEVRPALYGPPCVLNNCASQRTGRCRCWRKR